MDQEECRVMDIGQLQHLYTVVPERVECGGLETELKGLLSGVSDDFQDDFGLSRLLADSSLKEEEN